MQQNASVPQRDYDGFLLFFILFISFVLFRCFPAGILPFLYFLRFLLSGSLLFGFCFFRIFIVCNHSIYGIIV